MKESTTIQIERALKRRLRAMKANPRMSYNEVVWRMVEDIEDTSPAALRHYERMRKEMKEGNFVTMEQLERDLGLQKKAKKDRMSSAQETRTKGVLPIDSRPTDKRR